MKIPLSWLSEYVTLPVKITSEEIAEAFVKVGFEVEGIDEQGKDLKGPLVVGKVLSIEELPEVKKPIRYVGLDVGEKKTRYVIKNGFLGFNEKNNLDFPEEHDAKNIKPEPDCVINPILEIDLNKENIK